MTMTKQTVEIKKVYSAHADTIIDSRKPLGLATALCRRSEGADV